MVDTSIWVDHLRSQDARLARQLDDHQISTHPFVVGELAVGNLRNRDEILWMLNSLPVAVIASHDEALPAIWRLKASTKGLPLVVSV